MTTNTKTSTPELLLPAGDPEKLRYAIAYGADAVYLGLAMASLRTPTKGQQFTPDNLELHIKATQAQGVKAYVTANIFANNRDLNRIQTHFEQLEAIRPDAIILSDPGVFRLAKKYAPNVPIHLSTQANTLNVDACAFWQDLGVERVILAREVPLREMAEIHEQLPDLQLECFVHGSLCVAYSGRCVISDYLTDNTHNSNKGMCGNACRWEFESPVTNAPNADALPNLSMQEVTRPNDTYTFEEDQHGSYMLNSKDLCLVGHLRRLQEAGIISFKVEGRTKSVYYVATAGRIYREAIAQAQQTDTATTPDQIARWTYELEQAGNRGFTEGFLDGRPNSGAYTYHSSKTQQGSLFVASVPTVPPKNPIGLPDGYLAIVARNPLDLTRPLEWTTPSGVYPQTLSPSSVLDVDGLPWHKGWTINTNQVAWLPLPEGLPHLDRPWVLLRQGIVSTMAEPSLA
jgi:U32 family peptidase